MEKKGLFFIVLLVCFFQLSYVSAEGFTVTSVTPSSVITKSTVPSTFYWLINTQLNGGGQSITGSIDPSVIKGFMNGKAYSKWPLNIEVTSNSEQVFYDVVNEGVSVYRYDKQTYTAPENFLGIITGDPQVCPSGTSWDINVGKSVFGYGKIRYCITKQQVAIKGVYNNPNIGFNAKIKLSAGDIVKEKIICSGSSPGCTGSSVDFDGLGVASWTGSLVTGESAPNQDNFIPIKRTDSNQWQIVRRQSFDSYSQTEITVNSQFETLKSSLNQESDMVKADNQIVAQLNLINQKSSALLSDYASFTSSPFSSDSNTGKVTVTLQRSLTSPNILFRIRADWIGIVIPSGEPKILNVEAPKFSSGESGVVNVQVQNVGESAGTFSAMLVSCEPFIQSTTTQTSRKTLQPGDIDTIPISISGGSLSDELTKTCSVKVYDVNDPSIQVLSDVNLQLGKAKVCVPNKVFAEGKVIKKCNSDGSAIETVTTCTLGVVSDDKGGFSCASLFSSNKGKSCNYQCCEDTDCKQNEYCDIEIHACQQKVCVDILNSGNPADKLDIVFVGDGYTDLGQFESDVRKHSAQILETEPFKSNKNKINVHFVNKLTSIGCSIYGDRCVICDSKKSAELASLCPNDKIIELYNSDRWAGCATLNGDAAASSKYPFISLHEFGHSFGGLWDEYSYGGNGVDTTGSPNCDSSSSCSKWSNNGNGCFLGCTSDNFYRSVDNGIMRTSGSNTFGTLDESILSRLLNTYK
jgi:hypothetical protein